MIVYNTTVLDKDTTKNTLVRIMRYEQYPKFILFSLLMACGLIEIIYGHIKNSSTYFSIGYVICVFALLYAGMAMMAIAKAPKRVYKENQEICEYGVTYKYTFKEQSFLANIISKSKTVKMTYTYDLIKKVYEYEDHFELKFKRHEYLYVFKGGFEGPKMMEFFIKDLQRHKRKIIQKEDKKKEANV